MKRNQYTLLAEKYQNIQENDKEDVLAGLEELEFNPEEPITKDNIKRLGFELSNDHGVRNFYTIPGDDSKIGLKCDYYIQAGEVWNLVDGLNIRKYYVHTLGDLQNKYNKIKALNAGHQVVQEDDKEDIIAGLEELDLEQPLTEELLVQLGYEVYKTMRFASITDRLYKIPNVDAKVAFIKYHNDTDIQYPHWAERNGIFFFGPNNLNYPKGLDIGYDNLFKVKIKLKTLKDLYTVINLFKP